MSPGQYGCICGFWAIWGPSGSQHRPKIQFGSHLGSQNRPKLAQLGPRTAPRRLKVAPREPQEVPSWPRGGPRRYGTPLGADFPGMASAPAANLEPKIDQNRYKNGPQNWYHLWSLFKSILGRKIDQKKVPKLTKNRSQIYQVYERFLSRFCMHLWMDDSTILIQYIT